MFCIDFRERKVGVRGRERNIWLPVFALTGDGTHLLYVQKITLQPTEPHWSGQCWTFLSRVQYIHVGQWISTTFFSCKTETIPVEERLFHEVTSAGPTSQIQARTEMASLKSPQRQSECPFPCAPGVLVSGTGPSPSQGKHFPLLHPSQFCMIVQWLPCSMEDSHIVLLLTTCLIGEFP